MRIGIMGGTFDPIHNGHLMLGEYACRDFQLDEVWFMPNGNPPHKEQSSIQSDANDRADMVSLAIAYNPKFRLEEYEIHRAEVSYSYQTMEHFCSVRPKDHFYFIIGADSLFAIETWGHPERLLSLCTILAAFRDDKNDRFVMDEQIRKLTGRYGGDIRLLNTPLLDVSSHELRQMIGADKDVSRLLPGDVEAFIRRKNLYKEAK